MKRVEEEEKRKNILDEKYCFRSNGWKKKKKENGKVEEKYCFQSNKRWVEEEKKENGKQI